ncbi:MAG: hypothetical protein ACOVMN_05545 [Flexibacteraceae bacterium]
MFNKLKALVLASSLILTFNGCSKDDDGVECELIPFNAFTIAQDKELGMQVEAQIAAAPTEYPIMAESQNAAAYAYLRNIRDKILIIKNTEKINDLLINKCHQKYNKNFQLINYKQSNLV